jgi:hypothetical protein
MKNLKKKKKGLTSIFRLKPPNTLGRPCAFIPGRLISDNVLAAYKTLHSMHTQMWRKVGYMALKLDMSKAYD